MAHILVGGSWNTFLGGVGTTCRGGSVGVIVWPVRRERVAGDVPVPKGLAGRFHTVVEDDFQDPVRAPCRPDRRGGALDGAVSARSGPGGGERPAVLRGHWVRAVVVPGAERPGPRVLSLERLPEGSGPPGGRIAVTGQTENLGPVGTGANFSTGIYLSEEGVITDDDRTLATWARPPSTPGRRPPWAKTTRFRATFAPAFTPWAPWPTGGSRSTRATRPTSPAPPTLGPG